MREYKLSIFYSGRNKDTVQDKGLQETIGRKITSRNKTQYEREPAAFRKHALRE